MMQSLGGPTVSSILSPLLPPALVHCFLAHRIPPLSCCPSCSSLSLTHLHFSFLLSLVLQCLEYKVFPALLVPAARL